MNNKSTQKLNYYLAIFLFLFLFSGCSRNPDQIDSNVISTSAIPIKTDQPIIADQDGEIDHLYTTPLPPFKAISLAWFYHAPPKGVDPQILADYFSFFISTHGMEAERDHLKSLGSNAPFFQYVVLNDIVEPSACNDKPSDNQVANQPGDFCAIDRLYPDWFLKTIDGQRVHDKEPYLNNWFMDPSNPDWRQFWLERMRQRENIGWDGIFLDNLEVRPREDELPLLNYPDNTSFQQANLDFLKLIYNEFQPKNIRVFANILGVTNQDEWSLYLPYLDGAMIENFAVDWESGEYLSPERWELQMRNASATQAMGKEIILVAQGDQDDTSRQIFALASYLLINNGKAYFRYTNNEYDQLQMFMNYLDEPGPPLGDRYMEGGVWIRKFEHGQVIVDPYNQQAKIDFSK